jgi:hypothetical protein
VPKLAESYGIFSGGFANTYDFYFIDFVFLTGFGVLKPVVLIKPPGLITTFFSMTLGEKAHWPDTGRA